MAKETKYTKEYLEKVNYWLGKKDMRKEQAKINEVYKEDNNMAKFKEWLNEEKVNEINVKPVDGENPKVTILKQLKKDGTFKEIENKFKVKIDKIIFEFAPRFKRVKKGSVNIWSLDINDIGKRYILKVPVDMNTGKKIDKPSDLQKAIS